MSKYIYQCLTSEGEEINVESEGALFLEEFIDVAGRNDLMILGVKVIEEE